MAIIANGDGFVTAFEPRIVVGSHYVTVGAGRWIVRKV